MISLQVLKERTGCAASWACAVVNPREDPAPYLRATAQRGLRITHVIDTHMHGDQLCGGRAPAETAGAPYHLREAAPARFAFDKLWHGASLEVGMVHLTTLHTPGHTADSISAGRGPFPRYGALVRPLWGTHS